MVRMKYVTMNMREVEDLTELAVEQSGYNMPNVQDTIVLQKDTYFIKYIVREITRLYNGRDCIIYVKLLDGEVQPGKF